MPKLYVILDLDFGVRLMELESAPVWIIRSAANLPAVESVWASRTKPDHPNGVTVFNCDLTMTSEDQLLNQFDTIDLHHGPYSTGASYPVLEVIGSRLTEEIRAMLSEYGFTKFVDNAKGFTANRSLEEAKN